MNAQLSILIATAVAVTLSASIRFVVFVIGDAGQEVIRDRFSEWHALIDAGELSKIFTIATRSVEAFLAHYFGVKLFSFRYFLFLVFLAAAYFILISLPNLKSISSEFQYWAKQPDWPLYVLFVAICAVINTVALGLMRVVLRRYNETPSRARLIILLAALIAVPYFSGSTAFTGLLAFGKLANVSDFSQVNLVYLPIMWLVLPALPIVWTLTGQMDIAQELAPALYLSTLPAYATSAFLSLVSVGALALSASYRIISKPLSIIVQRLAETPKGPLTAIVDALGILIAVLTAWKEVLSGIFSVSHP